MCVAVGQGWRLSTVVVCDSCGGIVALWWEAAWEHPMAFPEWALCFLGGRKKQVPWVGDSPHPPCGVVLSVFKVLVP